MAKKAGKKVTKKAPAKRATKASKATDKHIINVSLSREAADKVALYGWGKRSAAISECLEKHLKVPKEK